MTEEDQLKKVLQLYKDNLPAGKTETFRIDGIDRLGIPIVDATFTAPGDVYANGLGYGATQLEAEVGAYGEMFEELYFYKTSTKTETVTQSFTGMLQTYGKNWVIDPLTLVLPAGSHYTPDLELKWSQINRLDDDLSVWIPFEFVANYNEYMQYPNQLITAITNGSGAGDTFERALLHGLLELLQRDGNADCFRALDRGIVIDKRDISGKTLQLMDDLLQKGLRVIPKLARTTCGCVSLYAVGDDLSDDDFPFTVAACGEAADPDFDRAVRKAVLECASSHSRKLFYHTSFDRKKKVAPKGYVEENLKILDLDLEEPRALKTHVEWLQMGKERLRKKLKHNVLAENELTSAKALPHFAGKTIKERLEKVLEGLRNEGLDIYYYRATPKGNPIQVVRAIVPGIEMEFASYHRIGHRGVKRLLDRGDHMISKVSGEGKKRIILTKEREKELGGRFWLDTQKLDELVGDLYPLYREPSAHTAMYALEHDYFKEE